MRLTFASLSRDVVAYPGDRWGGRLARGNRSLSGLSGELKQTHSSHVVVPPLNIPDGEYVRTIALTSK